MATRTWTNGSGLALSAQNLNSLEADLAAKADKTVATAAADGLMPKADKSKLDGASSTTSGNSLVQRSAAGNISANVFLSDVAQSTAANSMTRKDYVDNALSNKADKTAASPTAAGLMAALDKSKLDELQPGSSIIPPDLSFTSTGGWTADTANTPVGANVSYSSTVTRQVGTSSASDWIEFDPNRTYFYSFDIYSSGAGQVTYFELGWRDKAGAGVGSSPRLLSAYTIPTATWTHFEGLIGPGMGIVPPAGTARINPLIYVNHANGTQGNTLSLANFKIIDVSGVVNVVRGSSFLATSTLNGSMPAADKAKLDNAVSTATPSSMAIRDSAGRLAVADPAAVGDAATKNYVDNADALKLDKIAFGMSGASDLNTYTTTGNWNAQSSTAFTGGANFPVQSAGMLSVIARSGNDTVTQSYRSYTDGSTWTRDLYGGTWGNWVNTSNLTALNIMAYDAKGDGVANDGTAIQNAVNAAIAQNKDLYWPAGTYLKTVNITSFHTVKHRGPGAVKHGTDVFYVQPTGTQANKIYVATTGASDTYDGMTAGLPFRKLGAAINILSNYGPVIDGNWTFQLAAGTWSDRTTVPNNLQAVNPITVQGPIVNHPNVPTAIISEGYNIGAVAFRILESDVSFIMSNLLFSGYNGTASSAGIQSSQARQETFLVNCHFTDCFWGYTNQSSKGDVKGGIFRRCGYLGDTANTAPKSSRSGNGGGYRGLMGARHSIGTQGAGVLTNGPYFYDCVSGVFAQETCTGHVDWCTFEDNDYGVLLNVNSRANCDGSSFKRNKMDMRGIANSHFYLSTNCTFGTGADESTIKISLVQGAQVTDENRLFTNLSQSYNIGPKIVDTVFPNTTVTSTSLTTVYTATLAGNMWRDGIDSNFERKRLMVKVYGSMAGTAGTKVILLRLGSMNASATFTATETGTFEAEGVIFLTDKATQYLRLNAVRHLGANVRLAEASGTNALTADTPFTVESYVGTTGDSVTISAIDLSWA